jgi:hypothetical protein
MVYHQFKVCKRNFQVVGEVPIRVCSLEGGALEGVSPRVFPNLRRMHEYWNLPLMGSNSLFISLLLSHFV